MTVSASDKRFVRQRANHCCEYCRQREDRISFPCEVDHVIPLKHDGTDDRDNLALACVKCNAHKSHDLSGFDPLSGNLIPLFNPRTMQWYSHFEIDDDMVILGHTAIGRTTVRVLNMNTVARVENRQLLAILNEYPCTDSTP